MIWNDIVLLLLTSIQGVSYGWNQNLKIIVLKKVFTSVRSLTVVPAACQFKIQIQTLKYYCKSNDTLSYYFTFNVRRP